jgi:hypothetical protein
MGLIANTSTWGLLTTDDQWQFQATIWIQLVFARASKLLFENIGTIKRRERL